MSTTTTTTTPTPASASASTSPSAAAALLYIAPTATSHRVTFASSASPWTGSTHKRPRSCLPTAVARRRRTFVFPTAVLSPDMDTHAHAHTKAPARPPQARRDAAKPTPTSAPPAALHFRGGTAPMKLSPPPAAAAATPASAPTSKSHERTKRVTPKAVTTTTTITTTTTTTTTTHTTTHPLPDDASEGADQATQVVRAFGRDWALSGRLMLLLTPVIWSGYGVSIKYMFSLPWALSLPVFNFLRLGVASVLVVPGLLSYLSAPGPAAERAARWKSAAVTGGLELGLWTFLVNILQMLALKHSTASVAAFLLQLNSIFVPFAAYASRMESAIAPRVYAASVLSVAGVALFAADDLAAPFTWAGEGVAFLSALASTAFIIRSKTHAAHDDDADFDALIAVKILVQFAVAAVYALPTLATFASDLLASGPAGPHGPVAGLFDGVTPALAAVNAAVVLFNGVAVSWLSTVFQLKGQNAVPATEACVAFSSTPIWSALMAAPLGERFGSHGLVGAALIVLSTVLASVKTSGNKRGGGSLGANASSKQH